MKVLVIDDNSSNQAAAVAQLKEFETMIVASYDEGVKILKKQHEFDIVLVDLMMSAGDWWKNRFREELPMGMFLTLLAAKNGAKYVACFTDTDHHQSPLSEAFDYFNNHRESKPISFVIEGAQVILCNNRNWIRDFPVNDLATPCEYGKEPADVVRAKNWKRLLEYMVSGISNVEED